jgi:hypothetical protein
VSAPTTLRARGLGTPEVPAARSGMTIFANHPYPPITSCQGVSLRFVEASR